VVTLLLADVEGSTRMWERDSTEARTSMFDLEVLVDEFVTKFDGVRPVEQGEGDSFVARVRAAAALANVRGRGGTRSRRPNSMSSPWSRRACPTRRSPSGSSSPAARYRRT